MRIHTYIIAAFMAFTASLRAQMLAVVSTNGPALLTQAGQTHLPLVAITRTNFITGQRYTNTTGRVQLCSVTVHLTNNAAAGVAQMDLVIDGVRTNTAAQSSVATSLLTWQRRNLFDVANTNEVFYFTNRSTGTGNGASIVAGSGVMVSQ